jgi:hypothetical protein
LEVAALVLGTHQLLNQVADQVLAVQEPQVLGLPEALQINLARLMLVQVILEILDLKVEQIEMDRCIQLILAQDNILPAVAVVLAQQEDFAASL